MCTLQIFMQCYDKFFEIAPTEKENAELFVEDMVCHVLLNLFGAGTVDDVAIRFSAHRPMSLHHCFISIHAQCACEGFVLFPRSREHMKHAIEQGLTSIFKEVFTSVTFDTIQLRPSQCVYEQEVELPHRVPTQFI